jgi:nicotinate phosphoribosyltransferase
MSVFDRERLAPGVFKLDAERMRRGWYSDKYFINVTRTLAALAAQGYRFGGVAPDLSDIETDLKQIDVGSIEVEMQWFPRRRPECVVVGVDKALAMLSECTGHFEESGRFVNTFDQMEVWAVHDGALAPFDGDVLNVTPALKVRGRYRDFAQLETPTLGALTRGSRIATNVYELMQAARGKPVLYFPARFDAHELQASDGYAYQIAVQLFNQNFGKSARAFVSTDAQGDWWGGAGAGTIAHAAIACFLGDTVEATLAFAATQPPEIPRIALVDFENDCVGTSLAVLRAMFHRHLELTKAGQPEEARKYKLFGLRADTARCEMSRCRRSVIDTWTAASTRAWSSPCARPWTAPTSAGDSAARIRRWPRSIAAGRASLPLAGSRRRASASSKPWPCLWTSTASARGSCRPARIAAHPMTSPLTQFACE